MKRLLKNAIGRSSISIAAVFPGSRQLLGHVGIRTSQGLFGERIVVIRLDEERSIRLTNVDGSYLAFQLFWHGGHYYEPITRALLSQLIEPGDTFFDIGAHVGFFSLCIGRCVPGARLFAFEPNPRNFHSLQENLKANGLTRICRCEPIAISDQDGTATLYLTESDMSASLMKDFQAEDTKQIGSTIVETCSLDSYLKSVGVEQRMIIKVDIEGHEPAFFRGAAGTLERYRPDLVLEVLYDLDPMIVSALKSLGYRFYPITDQGLVETESPKLVKRYPFLFLNHLISVRPREELANRFASVRTAIQGLDLRQTSKHFPREMWPALWEDDGAPQAPAAPAGTILSGDS